MSTRFGQDFEVEVQARFEAGVWSVFVLLMFCRGYVESILNLGQLSEARFCQDFKVEIQAKFEAGVWLVFCC